MIRFDNLLASMVLTDINQAFSSDITYYEVRGRFYYITFVIDCFSRQILGHAVSKTLTTQATTLCALKRAVRKRGKIPSGIVVHSDGGGQYYAHEFLRYTSQHKFINSMCEYAYENGKAERINGTIKNNYLKYQTFISFESLVKGVDKAVYLYNEDRPHKSLNYQSPVNYENQLKFKLAIN